MGKWHNNEFHSLLELSVRKKHWKRRSEFKVLLIEYILLLIQGYFLPLFNKSMNKSILSFIIWSLDPKFEDVRSQFSVKASSEHCSTINSFSREAFIININLMVVSTFVFYCWVFSIPGLWYFCEAKQPAGLPWKFLMWFPLPAQLPLLLHPPQVECAVTDSQTPIYVV